jgi:hypothetical protein
VSDTPIPIDQLVRVAPERQAAVTWPLPVDLKLEDLVASAVEAGERTTRKEVLSALVASADLSGEQVGELLRWYRRARTGDLFPSKTGDNVVTFTKRPPGPRTHTRH